MLVSDQMFIQTSPLPIIALDLNERINRWNPAAEKLFGWSEQEVLGHPAPMIFAQPDNNFSALFKDIVTGKAAVAIEVASRRKDGFPLDIRLWTAALQDSQGKISGVMSIVTDLAEQKRLQETLQQSDRFIGQVAEAMPGILYVYDLIEQHNVYINRQIAETLGYSSAAVQAMGARVLPTLIHPDDLPKITAHFQQVATAKDGVVLEIEYRMRDAQGEWHWLISRELVFRRTVDGVPQQLIGTATDITRLKQIEEELRQSKERFQIALKNAPIIVFNQDTELRYTWVYSPACGSHVEEVVGKLDTELLTPEEAQQLVVIKRQVLASGVGTRLETSITLNGDVQYYDLTLEPMRDRYGEIVGITCVAIDITTRKQAETEILTLNAELEQRVLERTQALWRVNEELRREIGERQKAEAALQAANSSLEKQAIALVKSNEQLQIALEELTISQQEVQTQNDELIAIHRVVETERQRYQELFNFAPDAYLVTDVNGIIQEANQAAATLLCVPQKYLVNQALSVFVVKGDRPAFDAQLSQLVHLQRVQDWEVQLQGFRDWPFFAAIAVTTVLDPAGRSMGLRWLIRDISDVYEELRLRKQAEETIKQQAEWEQLLWVIGQNIRESLDLDRILTSTVTEVQQLLQADRVLVFRRCPDGGVGRTIAESVAPGQPTILKQQFPEETFPEECYDFYRQGNVRIVPEIEKDELASCLMEYFVELGVKSKLVVPLLQDASVWGVLSIHYCKHSPRQWEEWEIRLLKRLGSKVAIAIQQAELYQQLQHALAQEKELNELKSRFICMTSHEFRTPLSTILSSADLLEYYIQEGAAQKTLEHIHRIQVASMNMTELLNDILVLGKAEAGKLEFRPSSLDLVEFCGDLVEEMQLSVDSQHELTFVSHELFIPVYMDEKLLRHILTNLLSNAIKYSPKGGNVKLNLVCQDQAAIVQVQDEGIGIPKEDLPHLFESFHRAKNVGTISGSGLGLAIVKRSVDLHRGQIAIASEVGAGTTVTITLPLNSYSQTDEKDSSD